MRTHLNKLTIGLTPWQIAVVLAVFALSLIAAIGVALALRWWNERAVRSTHAEVSHKGLAELLARHRIEHTTQPQGDKVCDDCSASNPCWFVDSQLWNRVVGGPEATDDPGGVLCMNCFGHRAGVVLRVSALRSPDTDTGTDKCDECGRPYSTIYNIPNDIWAQIAPKPESLGEHIEHQAGGMLCTDCTTNRAREIGIELRFAGTVGWSDMAEIHGQEADAMAEVREAAKLLHESSGRFRDLLAHVLETENYGKDADSRYEAQAHFDELNRHRQMLSDALAKQEGKAK